MKSHEHIKNKMNFNGLRRTGNQTQEVQNGEIIRDAASPTAVLPSTTDGEIHTVTPEQDPLVQQLKRTANAPCKQRLQHKHLIRTKIERSDIEEDRERLMVVKARQENNGTGTINKLMTLGNDEVKKNGLNCNRCASKLKNGDGFTSSTTVTLSKGIEMKRTNRVPTSYSTSSMAGITQKQKSDVSKNHDQAVAGTSRSRLTRTAVSAHQILTRAPRGFTAQENNDLKKSTAVIIVRPTTSHDKVPPPSNSRGIIHEEPNIVSLAKSLPSTPLTNDIEPNNANPSLAKSSHEKPTKYFKSKFWDYVDPKKKTDNRTPRIEKDKAHDQKEVKSFMEKQREIRHLKEKKDEAEKQRALERKKKQLEELNDKCRGIISSSKPQTAKNPSTCAFIITDKQPMKQFRMKQSISPMRIKRRPEEHIQLAANSSEKPKESRSDIDLRTTLLLQEFENIVQKECMNILRVHQVPKSDERNTPEVVDVAVETTMSLFNGALDDKEARVPNGMPKKLKHFARGKKVDFQQKFNILAMRNLAASKIQAGFRGHKVRKILKEAHLIPFCQRPGPPRRWSFYQPPPPKLLERPLNLPARKLLVDNNSTQWDFAYIPPPPSMSSMSPKPKCLSYSASPRANKSELSRFNEPFPKEALMRLSVMHNSPKPKSFYERRHSDSDFKLPFNSFKRRSNDDVDETDGDKTLLNRHQEVDIPKFSTVLKEKVRLLEEKTTSMIRSQEQKISPSQLKRTRAKKPDPSNVYDSDSTDHASVILDSDITITNTITEEYIGPDEKKMREAYTSRTSPRSLDPSSLRRASKHFHRKKLALSFSPQSRSGSTTTVETDFELQASDGQTSEPVNKNSQKITPTTTKTGHSDEPTSSFGIEKYPAPALRLQFLAEQERLQILGKALETTLTAENQVEETSQIQVMQNQLDQFKLGLSNNVNNPQDYIIQIAKCQADCLKATAAVTKWMSELRKSDIEREHAQRDQQTVNMAAIVIAAVEEAKRMSHSAMESRTHEEVQLTISKKAHQVAEVAEVEVLTEEITIRKTPKVEAQIEVAENFTIKKKILNETPEEVHLTITKESPQAAEVKEVLEEITINKTPNVEQPTKKVVEEFTVKIPQPAQYEEEKVTEEVIIKNKKPTKKSADEITEEVQLTIKKDVPEVETKEVNVKRDKQPAVENEEVPAQVTLKPTRTIEPALEEVSKEVTLHLKKPTQTVEVNEETIIKLPEKKVEDAAEAILTVRREIPQEAETKVFRAADQVAVGKEQKPHEVAEVIETVILKVKDSKNKDEAVGEVSQQVTITKPKEQVVEDVSEEATIVEKKLREEIVQDVFEEITLMKVKPGKVDKAVEVVSEQDVITKRNANEQVVEDVFEEATSVNKKPHEEIVEVSDEITFMKVKPGKVIEAVEVVSEQDTITKQNDNEKTVEDASEEAPSVNKKPHEEIVEDVFEEIILIKVKSGKVDEDVEEEVSEQVTIPKQNAQQQVVEDVSEEVSIVKKKPHEEIIEEVSEDVTLMKGKPDEVPEEEEVSDEVTLKKKASKDKVFEDESEELTVKKLQPVDAPDDEQVAQITIKGQPSQPLQFTEEPEEEFTLIRELLSPILLGEQFMMEKITSKIPFHKEAFEEEESVVSKPVDEEVEGDFDVKLKKPYSVEDEVASLGVMFQPKDGLETQSEASANVKSAIHLLSSTSYTISKFPSNTCKDSQVREIISQHLDYIWDYWTKSKSLPPDYEAFCSKFSVDESNQSDEDNVYELLMSDAICESIQEALKFPLSARMDKAFIEKIRPGPLSLNAQKLKIPRTKEQLFQVVFNDITSHVPPGVVIYSGTASRIPEKRSTKWASKPRDLADEVLAQELVKEDREWLDCWPEEVLVIDRISESILKRALSQVLSNFQTALS